VFAPKNITETNFSLFSDTLALLAEILERDERARRRTEGLAQSLTSFVQHHTRIGKRHSTATMTLNS
jgi:hypothetical protein